VEVSIVSSLLDVLLDFLFKKSNSDDKAVNVFSSSISVLRYCDDVEKGLST